MPIIESGMSFGPFPEGHCFYIEKSGTYKKIEKGVQIAEFLLLRYKTGKPPTVWVIEAKSSTPHPGTLPGFDDFISEMKDKLNNALVLGVAACLNRHSTAYSELSELFKTLDLSTVDFQLVLVIKGHKEEWLPPLQDALTKTLHSTVKTWALSALSVNVMNDDIARSFGLIS